MRHEIRDIQYQLGITTIFVTHDQVEALSMADRVAVMKRGRVVQIGNPTEIYEHPQDPFVAEFVGRINSFSAKVISASPPTAALDLGDACIRLPRDMEPGHAVLIMVRPHRLDLRPLQEDCSPPTARNAIKGHVRKVIYIGDMVQYRIGTDGPELLFEQSTRTASGTRFAVNDAVVAEWDVADTLVFESRAGSTRNPQ